jgi:uncharacterized membrane protein YeaQ/YmgE (transglycosylase-associated protein family)
MSILAWVVLGLVAGFVASKLVNKTGEGVLMDIALGIVGALAGGWLFNQIGQPGVTGLDLWSLIVAVIGAVVVLVLYHAITGRAPRRV